MWKKDGIRGINKGVNAVALRQMTNWGSRCVFPPSSSSPQRSLPSSSLPDPHFNLVRSMGFARLAEQSIRNARGIPEGKKLDTLDRIAASTFGGALGCWNQPIEVVRVEVRRCPLRCLLRLVLDSARTSRS